MAHEIRYIAFDRREVAEMLRAFGETRGIGVPDGRVVEVQKQGEGVRVTFEDDNARQATVELGVAEAVACMLGRCLERRYPVAQRFSKHVEVTGNALVLAMSGRAQAFAGSGGGLRQPS